MNASLKFPSQTDNILDRIDTYEQLNAPTLLEGNRKYAEQLTYDEVKQELLKIGEACKVIRTLTQHPDHTYFGGDNGFPQQQGPNNQTEAYFALKTGEVLKGLEAWVKNTDEDGDILMSGEKQMLLYALGDGYEILRGYFGFDEDDPWNKTVSKISGIQSYKEPGFPKPNDIQSTMHNIKSVRTS